MRPIIKQVKSIQFALISPDEIKKIARAKIVTPELYDMDGYPVDGGLMDLRLGAIDPGVRCRTCGGKLKECLGHFGYIELARPVVHLKYVGILERLLKCTCQSCGKILLTEAEIAKSSSSVKRVAKARNVKKCPYCRVSQEKIKLEKPTSFYLGTKRVYSSTIVALLAKISKEDQKLLGVPPYFKPENAIIPSLLVPPVTVRPSITLETGERSEDDLTHKLSDIIRANQRLWENLNAGAPEVIIEDLWDLLQYHVTTFFDNAVPQIPPARHRSGQPLKTIAERIKGKEGRIRHNLAGKRVDFSSRSVVSSDPYIAINEVGVPLSVAMTLTIPVRVNELNLEHVKKYVQNGPKIYPGSNYIIRPDGKKKRITEDLKSEILEEIAPGYIVERHLQDHDAVLFNRHPSLHKLSLMAHYVKILPGRTFRLNPAVTFPYNADYDGDEMNLHVPQNEEARSEAIKLLDVKNHIITPKNGTNVLGCIEDAVTGCYILSSHLEIPREDAIQYLTEIGIELPKEVKRWPKHVKGEDIILALLPKDFKVKLPLDVKSIGIEEGKLIIDLTKQYSNDEVIKILENIFRLGCKFLTRHGFTVGIKDVEFLGKDAVQESIGDAYKKVDKVLESYYNDELKALPGKTIEETREIEISIILNSVRTRVGGIISEELTKDIEKENPVNTMIFSGAKGSIINRVQMGALFGQQTLWAKRIEIGYKKRTLSHFAKGDLSPASKGFIASSFFSGLRPNEFFFSAITGRDSLMDTALRTPKSGYLYRRLANALQDIKVEYDETIRDGASNIIQFKYGGDGLGIEKKHLKEKITPGEAIGIITAQSFGEPSTQMTLNVFHFAGVAEFAITLGLPRLIEIFDAKKVPATPVMEVYLKKEYNTEDTAENVANKIKETKLIDISNEILLNFTEQRIEIMLDKKIMRDLKLNADYIIEKMKEANLPARLTKDGISVKPKEVENFKELYKIKEKLKSFIVRGIKGIKEVLPIKREGERDYVILTYGSNLKDVILLKEVDDKRTITNNPYEIESVFGIEAARQAIINEVKSVIEKQGIDIDIKHVMLVSDLMTSSGSILGITRTGIIKEKGSILARASFETPIKHFVNSTITGEKDIFTSVIENVMINQPVPVGTGLPGLIVKVGASGKSEKS